MSPPPKLGNGRAVLSTQEKQTGAAPGRIQETRPEIADEQVNPPDFDGHVETDDEIPSPQVLRALENHIVLDSAGKTHPFKSLYSGPNVARRILVIFVRHFFCGNCQEYLRALSASITPEALLGLPASTFIVVVGCGSHELIDAYVRETSCLFPVYADPTRRLYADLGMVRTLQMGARPAYLRDRSAARNVASGIFQGLRQVRAGLALKMGDQRQVGGEFLFEPASRTLETPILSPPTTVGNEGGEEKNGYGFGFGFGFGDGDEDRRDERVEEKCVTWCHRMRTTRDHAEIPELMEVLGLEGDGAPVRDAKRWRKALETRKGTGLSMAGQMGRVSADSTSRSARGSVEG